MPTAIICIILLAAVVIGVRSTMKRAASGCCGSSGGPAEKRQRVADRNPEHYPFHRCLKIDGMSCGNCAIRVENALNKLEGVWARVDLAQEEAVVYMKTDQPEQLLKDTVKAAGYTVYKVMNS